MFASITVTPVRQCWALEGPAGPHLDRLLACAIMAGCTAESIAPATRYRLTGDDAWLTLFAVEVGKLSDAGVTLGHEPPPAGCTVSSRVEPGRAYRRNVHVHGPGFEMVARAVDRGLTATCAGANRWAVTGASATLAAWLGDDLRERLGMTPEQIAAEDAGLSVSVTVEAPTVNVNLPPRVITSDITHDAEGRITHVEQTERDAA